MYSPTVVTGTWTPNCDTVSDDHLTARLGSVSYIFGQDNSGVSASVAELGRVFEHVCEFCADSSRNSLFEDFAVKTLDTTFHAVVFAPQGGKIGPANDDPGTKGIHSSWNIQQSPCDFALRRVSMM